MIPNVSFVSSGPGDPELLTMRAIKRIKSADLIFYDDLSSGEILKLASEAATLFSVGKRAGLNSPKQSQVSTLLVNYGKTGKKIVRLKSGDSGIFSRLEEEITALDKNNIPFEIIQKRANFRIFLIFLNKIKNKLAVILILVDTIACK